MTHSKWHIANDTQQMTHSKWHSKMTNSNMTHSNKIHNRIIFNRITQSKWHSKEWNLAIWYSTELLLTKCHTTEWQMTMTFIRIHTANNSVIVYLMLSVTLYMLRSSKCHSVKCHSTECRGAKNGGVRWMPKWCLKRFPNDFQQWSDLQSHNNLSKPKIKWRFSKTLKIVLRSILRRWYLNWNYMT